MQNFSDNELNLLDNHLRVCGWSRSPFSDVKFKWVEMHPFGTYWPRQNIIAINNMTNGMMKEITPCVIHELTHVGQRYRSGSLLGYWAGLGVMRYWWEKEAVANEEFAMRTLGLQL